MTYPAALPRVHRRAWPQRLLIAFGLLLATTTSIVVAGAIYTKRTFAQVTKVDLGQTLDSLGASSSGPTEVENYLFVGSDSRVGADPTDADYGGIGSASATGGERSDTLMVMRYDPRDGSTSLLSIPRDLYVTIAGTGRRDKINSAYGKGQDVLVKTIQQALGIPIHHYVEVNFAGFKNLVDAIGGVSVRFDAPLYDPNTGLRIKVAGCVHLNGVQARQYVRSRHLQVEHNGKWTEDPTADIGRIGRQQSFMRLAMNQAIKQASSDPVAAGNILNAGLKNLTFDKGADLPGLVNQLRKLGSSDLTTYTVPADPRTIGDQSVLIMNQSAAQDVLDYFRGGTTRPTTAGPGAAVPMPDAAPTTKAPAKSSTTKAPAKTTTSTTPAPTTTVEATASAKACS